MRASASLEGGVWARHVDVASRKRQVVDLLPPPPPPPPPKGVREVLVSWPAASTQLASCRSMVIVSVLKLAGGAPQQQWRMVVWGPQARRVGTAGHIGMVAVIMTLASTDNRHLCRCVPVRVGAELPPPPSPPLLKGRAPGAHLLARDVHAAGRCINIVALVRNDIGEERVAGQSAYGWVARPCPQRRRSGQQLGGNAPSGDWARWQWWRSTVVQEVVAMRR